MTNGELGIIVTAITVGLGAVSAVIRLGINSIIKSIDASSEAMLKFVASAARLEVKLDQAHAAAGATLAAVHEVVEEVTGNHDIPAIVKPDPPPKQPPKKSKRTTPRGVPIIERSRTHSGDDER